MCKVLGAIELDIHSYMCYYKSVFFFCGSPFRVRVACQCGYFVRICGIKNFVLSFFFFFIILLALVITSLFVVTSISRALKNPIEAMSDPNPSVSKSNRLHFVILWFYFNSPRYILYIPLS
jgi:hypothetical protein